MTPEFSFDPANYEAGSISFSWFQAQQLTTPTVADQQGKLAVRVGGVWYASVENENEWRGCHGDDVRQKRRDGSGIANVQSGCRELARPEL